MPRRNLISVEGMDEEVRSELDELRRRIAELETIVSRLLGTAPVEPLPPERDPFRHPKPPPPGGYPHTMSDTAADG